MLRPYMFVAEGAACGRHNFQSGLLAGDQLRLVGLAGFCGDVGEEVLEALAMLFGNDDGDAHAETGLDPADEAVDFDGSFGADARGEAGTNPERVGGFDEHAVGADVSCAGTQNG
jgi:hypothetical protein